ncbi:MAG: nucleotide exchange factor GrpE [Deltaproteobacteria bacterium]|nr:nucleotide exchange factor GrpE [Deltaproteobacteria bacterium]MBW2595347.1 nucleotide exchange factor GrpE [Deltaproteobacteria bacterium]
MVEELVKDREHKEKEHSDKAKQDAAHAKPVSKKELLTRLEETGREASENYDKYLRACAEFENYKKRAVKDRENFIKYGNETLIKDILPTVDSMERALEHASNSEDFEAFVDGLNLIRDNFISVLGKHGVEGIDAIGKDFDPNFHEAMMQVEDKKEEDNKVVGEFEKGYLLNGRLLRPSKVSISKSKNINK